MHKPCCACMHRIRIVKIEVVDFGLGFVRGVCHCPKYMYEICKSIGFVDLIIGFAGVAIGFLGVTIGFLVDLDFSVGFASDLVDLALDLDLEDVV